MSVLIKGMEMPTEEGKLMYDDLVKRLREPCQYENCILCQQAAIAIEELSLTAESYKRSMEAWADEAANVQPRWISVTERLPEEYETVLLVTRAGEVIVGFYEYDSEYESFCDMSGFRKLCTHWMPLPEPPKEEL